MSKLEDLEKELYGADRNGLDKRITHKKLAAQRTANSLPTSWLAKKTSRTPSKESIFVRLSSKKKIWGVLTVLVIAAGAALLFFYLGGKGREADIKIESADRIESGRPTELVFMLKNTSGSSLKEVELAVVLPVGSKILEGGSTERSAPPRYIQKLADLNPGEERKVEVVARLFGKEKEDISLEGVLSYRPANLQARFTSKVIKTINIERVPLVVSWDAPESVSSGQEVEVTVGYLSDSEQSLGDLTLQIDYPSDFIFLSAIPRPDTENNVWKIGSLKEGQEGIIKIKGKLGGAQGELKIFRGKIGILDEQKKELTVYSETTKELEISVSPLSVTGLVGESRSHVITPGEGLYFILRYRNNSVLSLKNISIIAFLESGSAAGSPDREFTKGSGRDMLDMNTLNVGDGGIFDSQTQSIVWNPNNLPILKNLEPGQEGQVGFGVQVRDSFPMRSGADKNLVLRLRSVIESPETPEEFKGTELKFEDRLDLKSKTKVAFSAKSLFRSFLMVNSGSLPPKVSSKTTYTIVWELRNFSNDLQGAEVRATLPPNVKWENVTAPSSARIVFSQSSGEVRWVIGSLAAGAGVLNPVLTGAFQVSVVPSESDIGKKITLIDGSVFTANDSFAREEIRADAGPLTTELKNDSTTSANDWRVVK